MEQYQDLGFAKLDLSRKERTGMTETIFCSGKTCQQLAEIVQTFIDNKQEIFGTRCTREQYDFLKNLKIALDYNPVAGTIRANEKKEKEKIGLVAICSAGTADMAVAEEAAETAEFCGACVERFYDVGVAGLHRLTSKIDAIRKAQVIIVVAGMEGALGSVISGLVAAPVIAVPTSVGYGAAFNGIAPLLAMLNSCAEGMAVVNIDNGYGAAVMACKILRNCKKS